MGKWAPSGRYQKKTTEEILADLRKRLDKEEILGERIYLKGMIKYYEDKRGGRKCQRQK